MKLIVFVLNNEELLEQVLEAYVDAGIDGATILDSEGMGRFLSYEVPLFAEFRPFMKGNKPYNHTILAVVRDERAVGTLRKLLDEICGGLDNPGTGILFSVPVDWAVGLLEEQMQLSDLFDERAVELDLPKGGKEVVISRLAELAELAGAVTNGEALRRQLSDREEQSSSAIGGGIAIPHVLSNTVTRRALGFARSNVGVAFNAPDGEPVSFFFLLLAPESSVTDHLRVLSRLARFLHDPTFRSALASAATAAEVREALLAKENE